VLVPTPKASQETITLIEPGQTPHRGVAYRPTRAHPTKAVSENMHGFDAPLTMTIELK
jgi:hypothetical protein